MLSDFGIAIDSRLFLSTDSSAAKGICSRRGLGKVRHIDANMLWLQDRVQKGHIVIKKVSGESTTSDALTNYLDVAKMNAHLASTGQFITSGRHTLMPCVTSNQ